MITVLKCFNKAVVNFINVSYIQSLDKVYRHKNWKCADSTVADDNTSSMHSEWAMIQCRCHGHARVAFSSST